MGPNKFSQLKATYQGALRTMNSRNLSPATKEILRLLASKAEEAICKEAAGIDTHPFLEEIREIKVLNKSVEKRSADVARLSDLEKMAKLGDYAMMYCQRLEKEAGESFFIQLMWDFQQWRRWKVECQASLWAYITSLLLVYLHIPCQHAGAT